FAHEIKVYEKKEALRASGSRMAVESCIPSGTFRLQSQGGGPIDPPESEVIYHGRVLETAMLTNPFTHLSFHWTRIRTLGGEVDLVADMVNDLDRKSTRLNSSHVKISYAVFCLKKKKKKK